MKKPLYFPNTYFRDINLNKRGCIDFNGIFFLKTKVTIPHCLMYFIFCQNGTGHSFLNCDHSNLRESALSQKAVPLVAIQMLSAGTNKLRLHLLFFFFSLLISSMAPKLVCQQLNGAQNLWACTRKSLFKFLGT